MVYISKLVGGQDYAQINNPPAYRSSNYYHLSQ